MIYGNNIHTAKPYRHKLIPEVTNSCNDLVFFVLLFGYQYDTVKKN